MRYVGYTKWAVYTYETLTYALRRFGIGLSVRTIRKMLAEVRQGIPHYWGYARIWYRSDRKYVLLPD